MITIRLIAVATLSMLAFAAHGAPPSKDTSTSKSAPVPFNAEIYMSIPPNSAMRSVYHPTGIPAGKRAIIENYSYKMEMAAGQVAKCQLSQGFNVNHLYMSTTPSSQFNAAASFHYLNERTLWFLESDDIGDIRFACERSSALGTSHLYVSLNGWLVDAN